MSEPADLSSTKLAPAQPTTIVAQKSIVATQFYEGPIPSPEMLREYETAVPGAAARILSQWEKQTNHRIDLEQKVITGDVNRAHLGLVAGTFVATTALAVAAFAIYSGNATAGAIIGSVDIASLVSVFVYGTHMRSKERQLKSEQRQPQDAKKRR